MAITESPLPLVNLKDPAYCLARLPVSPKISHAIRLIQDAYEADHEPWVVGYSGGKDSSCVLKLLFHALRAARFHHKPVTVLYCDTGVEVPAAAALACRVLESYAREARAFGLPIGTRVATPALRDRFFVKVIGRGYPPPTDKFRWCTDRLRISPVSQVLAEGRHTCAVVALGVRESESATRALTLSQYAGPERHWRRQRGKSNRRLFMPIIDFDLQEVWQTLFHLRTPYAVFGQEIADLYAAASGECPTVRDAQGAPCGKARFGCWTCTVAKHGTTLRNLIAAGHSELSPLLEYRLWLEKHRNNPRYRWKRRRNGQPGPGPMTLAWRRLALDNLIAAERRSGLPLITPAELTEIIQEWVKDEKRSP